MSYLRRTKEPDIAEAFVATLTAPEAVWTELGLVPGAAGH